MNLASGANSPDSTLLVVLQILMALVAGLLFGNLLISARKAL
ncbi:uncharacterized protein YneF (UPF0154 family) [Pseudoxanthomonas winnipegensis]|nr:uncharacterized protein YneF (UPF0154 family) [Pseudoxanthomonas winnipegensis]